MTQSWHGVKRQECQVRRGGEASNSGDLSLQHLEPGNTICPQQGHVETCTESWTSSHFKFYRAASTLHLYTCSSLCCATHTGHVHITSDTWHILGPNMGTDPRLQPCWPLFGTSILQLSKCTYHSLQDCIRVLYGNMHRTFKRVTYMKVIDLLLPPPLLLLLVISDEHFVTLVLRLIVSYSREITGLRMYYSMQKHDPR